MNFEQLLSSSIKFNPDADQRLVIESVRNTVVSAGAGAGKTTVLSWRFLRLVMEQGVGPDQILTLTFTKKAANDMHEKIYKRLLEAKDSIPEDSLDRFRSSTITTLDSFCSQIVRSDCTAYGFPRDYANLSDQDLETMAQRLANRFITDPENEAESNLIASLMMPSSVMGSFFLRIAFLSKVTGDYDAQRISSEFHEEIKRIYHQKREQLRAMLDTLSGMEMTSKFSQQYDRIRRHFDDECITEEDYFTLNSASEEIKDLVREEIRTILYKGSRYPLLQNTANGEVEVSLLQKAVEKFTSLMISEKRRMGLLTFSDVSELAVRILADNLALRNVYKKKFRYVMIDEFQDNNSIQRDLLFLLSERDDVKGKRGIIPSLEDLDQGKLFFVGDEKQSIYSFRGADVSVFRRLQSDIGKDGRLSLNTNYRSQEKLIRHFNDVFPKILCDNDRDYQARYNPIVCGRNPDGTDSKIIFATYDRGNLEDDEMEAEVLEAEAIGEYCRRILMTDEFLVAGQRPKPEEVAIIFRASSNQMNIEKSLKRRGIEYQIAETRSLMIDAVSNDFYSLLNLVLYPEDTRSLVSALKSPFCGLCERSIYSLVVEKAEVLPVDQTRYAVFCTFLEKLRESAFRMTISQLVEFIYMEGGYKAYLSSSVDRGTFVEHYEYLFTYAVSFDKAGKSLSDYVRFLRENIGKSDKLPEINVLHKSKSGVQIMTVHKSKGLEFKVVIFSGLGNGPPPSKEYYAFNYGGNLVATESKDLRKILEEDSKDREKAEKKRIMYVAMTRAKDHLIMIGGYKGTTMADLMSWYTDAIGADLSNGTCRNPDVIMEDVSGTQRKVSSSDDVPRLPERPQGLREFRTGENRISVTQIQAIVHHPFQKNPDVSPLPASDVDDLIQLYGLQDGFGTLCHQMLEYAMSGREPNEVPCDLCEKDADNARLLAQAKAYAQSFLSSSLYLKLVKGRSTRQELRFYTWLEDLPDMAVEGVIDLMVLGDGTNLVIDYKTDSIRDPEGHRIQVLTYVKVAEQIFKKPCLGTLFYLRDASIGPIWDRDGNCVELPSSL